MARSKNAAGCSRPDAEPGLVDGVHQVEDVAQAEPAAEVARGGRVRDSLGAQGVEVDLVVAPQLEVLDPGAAGQDVEGDIEDVVGLVIGEVALEEVEVLIDVGDQPGAARDQEHGADAAGGEPLDPIGQFVVDVAGGDHGSFAFGAGPVLDAAEDSALALPELVEDIGMHSKASVVRESEDVLLPPLFPSHRGFSSFFG